MTKEETLKLIYKFNAGQCTEEEAALLESWYVQQDQVHQQEVPAEMMDQLLAQIHQNLPGPHKTVKLWKKIAVAAVVLFTLSAGFYYFSRLLPGNSAPTLPNYAADASPGGNRATLKLADGQTIDLGAARNGQLATQAGIKVAKTKSGELIYTATGDAGEDHSYNTLSTPAGGQYLVELPDRSRVWLNAASELVFPVRFSDHERRVELRGEAYFEVTKDAAHPFVVSTSQQELKVLGTHFTVNAYADEPGTMTTLMEGSVQVSAKGYKDKYVLLKPDQQSMLTDDFNVRAVNAASENAWINGKFVFNEEPLESILRKVARWYDIKVSYHDASARHVAFGGTMSRFSNVSKVLGKLEATGDVRFDLKKSGNEYQLTVYKK
jgi:transmembrane sensor